MRVFEPLPARVSIRSNRNCGCFAPGNPLAAGAWFDPNRPTPTLSAFHTVDRFRLVELARTGGYTQCSKTSGTIDRKLRRNSLGLTLWKELPQFLERARSSET